MRIWTLPTSSEESFFRSCRQRGCNRISGLARREMPNPARKSAAARYLQRPKAPHPGALSPSLTGCGYQHFFDTTTHQKRQSPAKSRALSLGIWSGRRESNPRHELGNLYSLKYQGIACGVCQVLQSTSCMGWRVPAQSQFVSAEIVLVRDNCHRKLSPDAHGKASQEFEGRGEGLRDVRWPRCAG